MVDKNADGQVKAFEEIYRALKPLDDAARQRVVASVFALLGTAAVEWITPIAPPLSRPDVPERAETPGARPKAIVELLSEKEPGTNAQRIALFAYHREKHEGVPRFERSDLKGYFAKARLSPPTNFDRDFVEAVRKGWIHEDGSESYVTSKGIESVESGFGGERKYSARPGRPPSRKNAGPKADKARRRTK
jgi:hypothetical protein